GVWTFSMVSSSAMRFSRRDHDLADDCAVLDEAQAFARLIERQHLVDHRLHLSGADEFHEPLEILIIKTVRAHDFELEAPHVAQILLRVVTGGGATDEEFSTTLE